MRTLKPSRVGYAAAIDHLYVAFGEGGLGDVDHEDEVGPWITLQYSWPGNELAGMEIYGLVEHFGKPPLSITVPGRDPFVIDIPALDGEKVA